MSVLGKKAGVREGCRKWEEGCRSLSVEGFCLVEKLFVWWGVLKLPLPNIQVFR